MHPAIHERTGYEMEECRWYFVNTAVLITPRFNPARCRNRGLEDIHVTRDGQVPKDAAEALPIWVRRSFH